MPSLYQTQLLHTCHRSSEEDAWQQLVASYALDVICTRMNPVFIALGVNNESSWVHGTSIKRATVHGI